MGDVNFFGSFPAAHKIGDPGGDMVVSFEGDTRKIHSGINEWYVRMDKVGSFIWRLGFFVDAILF